jgi:hypothetical protein
MRVFISGKVRKISPACRGYSVASANRKFQFQKRRQLFLGLHDVTLSIAAMRVSNPDRSPVGINRCDAAPTPTCFTEITSDDFSAFFRDMFPKLDGCASVSIQPLC